MLHEAKCLMKHFNHHIPGSSQFKHASGRILAVYALPQEAIFGVFASEVGSSREPVKVGLLMACTRRGPSILPRSLREANRFCLTKDMEPTGASLRVV